MNPSPYFKEIVLLGGGHAHALFIHRWGMEPVAGVRLTLVSPHPQTPYSGMLPGLIAGHYEYDDTHIDLARVCHWAGVRFIQDRAIGLNLEAKTLLLNTRPELNYDLLAIDIGSTPDHSVPGVKKYANPIKPIAEFYQHWLKIIEHLHQTNHKALEIVVVGGGAGSVETILAMAWKIKNDDAIKTTVNLKLVFRSATILSSYQNSLIRTAQKACAKVQISLHANFSVKKVEVDKLLSEAGQSENFDYLFWCTQAGAPDWLGLDGLNCTESGFINVNENLQSINSPDIFASGDIAHMVDTPIVKAGVYAVRQAPFLFENILARLFNKPMKAFQPQNDFLSLLALGGKTACGGRKPFTFSGAWVWRWKDRIDQEFMRRFIDLPEMKVVVNESEPDPVLVPNAEQQEKLSQRLRCAGCGAKIGAGVLAQVLQELTGAYQPEDASIVSWPYESLVQTIDQIKAPIDDPFLFGRISLFHALSDLYAMNAQPDSLQLAVTLPFAGREVQKRELRRFLQGILSACHEEKVILLGGHSAEGSELSVAISANGHAETDLFRKCGFAQGDILVLSKPIGNGLILAGQMSNLTHGKDLTKALAWMNRSNSKAAYLLQQMTVSCCTDISGFGLLGHLSEMLADSPFQVELLLQQLPMLSGALKLANAGVRSSLYPQNEQAMLANGRWQHLKDCEQWPVLLDPQTSGGLLAGISSDQQEVAERAGFMVIGRIC